MQFFQYWDSAYKWLNSSSRALVHDNSVIPFSETIPPTREISVTKFSATVLFKLSVMSGEL